MMTEEEIRAMIVNRLLVAENSCNSHHRMCVKQQIRGLLAALTGEVPTNSDDIPTILRQAGIPHSVECGTYDFVRPWMISHGFKAKPDGSYQSNRGW